MSDDDDRDWEDITEEFRLTAAELKIGVLIHDKTFTLHDGMTAVEMMHPQMDIGTTRAQTRPILRLVFAVSEIFKGPFSIEEYIERDLLPWSNCTPEQLISVFDVQLAAFVNWFKGQSLAQVTGSANSCLL